MIQKGLIFHQRYQAELQNSNVFDDLTPRGNTSTAYNTSFTTDRKGRSNGALSFNGTTSYMDLDNVVSDIASQDTGSIVWKGQIGDFATTSDKIWSFADTDGTDRIFLQVKATGILQALCNIGGATKWLFESDDTFAEDTDYTIVLTHDGTTPALFVNGASKAITIDGSSTDITAWFANTSIIDNGRIGCIQFNSASNSNFCDEIVEEFAIYDRALSTDECLLIHEEYKPEGALNTGDLQKDLVFHAPLGRHEIPTTPENVTYPRFSVDDGTWSKQTGWTIDTSAGVASCDGSQVAGSSIQQNSVFTNGVNYLVEINVTAVSAGSINFWIGGTQLIESGIDTAGRYEYVIRANNTGKLQLEGTVDFIGSLDLASVKEIPTVGRNMKVGSTLVVNGGFDADTDWTKGGSVSIGSGVATFTHDGTANNRLSQSGVLTAGATYVLSYEVTANSLSGGTSGQRMYTTQTTNPYIPDSVGVHSVIFVCNSAIADIRTYPDGATTGTISFDNVSFKPLLSADITPYSNHCEVHGADIQSGYAEFDGTDDYMKLLDGADTHLDGLTNFLVTFWANPESADNNDRFITKGITGTGEWMISVGNSNQLRCYFKDSDDVFIDFSSTLVTFTLGEWALIGVFIDYANSRIKVFKNDSVEDTSSTVSWTGVFTNSRDLIAGNTYGLTGNPYEGKIDDIRIYKNADRISSVADFVQKLYEKGRNG